jgi:hypothetical protein
MTLYEFNKNGYSSLPDLTEEDFERGIEKITTFLEHTWNQYYMILNHDIHYYTLYHWEDNYRAPDEVARDMAELMGSLGAIKAIEVEEDRIEFWITNITGECQLYALFAYDNGVITV